CCRRKPRRAPPCRGARLRNTARAAAWPRARHDKQGNPRMKNESSTTTADLEQLVAEADRGGRHAGGVAGATLAAGALVWSLFQLWYASPLPFSLHWGIFNDTEARALHLGIAMFLGYLAYPATKRSARDRMPWYDWVLALAAGFCGAYLYLFYNELATRPGQPTSMDVATA